MLNGLFEVSPSCILPFVNNDNWLQNFVEWTKRQSNDMLAKLILVWQEIWGARNASWLGKKVSTSLETGRNVAQLATSYCGNPSQMFITGG